MEEDLSFYNKEGTLLRKTQLKEIDILCEIDKICQRHGIKYWIDFGTLLGAVRHKGFIPWDDDLDISMLSSDYESFIKIAPKELPDWLFLQNNKTDKYYNRKLCKVRDVNSLFIENFDNFKLPYKKGIFVDIFEVIDCPNMSRKLFKMTSKWYAKTFQFFSFPQMMTFKNIIAGVTFPIIHWFLHSFFKLANIRKSNCVTHDLDTSVYHVFFNKNIIFPLKKIQFEGKEFNAPCNPDEYLKNIYNDYMKIPDSDERRVHSRFIFDLVETDDYIDNKD